MIELDVQMTKDGELVCFHDWTMDRLGGRTTTIEQSECDQVTRITIAPDGSRVPLLQEALEVIPESMTLNLEIKRRKAHAGKLARIVAEHLDGRGRVLVSSFDQGSLEKLHKLNPDLPLAPIEKHQPGELIEAGKDLDAFSLHCHRRLVTRHFIERAASEGFPRVLAYTVNQVREAEQLLREGISGFFTDFPTQMVEHFKKRE